MYSSKKRLKFSSLIFILMISFTVVILGGCSEKINFPEANAKSQEVSTNKIDTNKTVSNKSESNKRAVVKGNINGNLKVNYIDVGQADSILIQQGKHAMLIDAGNNDDGEDVVKYIKSQGVTYLDYVVGTHPHEDHIGGLDNVINSFNIGKIYLPRATSNTRTFRDVVKAMKTKGMKAIAPNPGESFNLGDAKCNVLAPNGNSYEGLNNYSIVIKLQFGNTSFMFTGDAEVTSEREILEKGFNLKADVLKLGHHGSNSSSSDEFLNKVNPKYAVISLGKDNKYGHPHRGTMEKMKSRGIPVYRTDENGTIIAVSDGKKISFNTKAGSYKFKGNGKSALKKYN